MSKSVSNDALWEKLSEISEQINSISAEQKEGVSTGEQANITSLLTANKDEIVKKSEKCIQGLGTHCDSHFKTMYKHIEQLEKDTEGVYKILSCMSALLQEQKEQPETKPGLEQEADESYLNFRLFKVMKTSLTIAALVVLVFILTIFSMKQQNDYSLLNGECYKQRIVIREMQVEVDSLKNTVINQNTKKR